MAADWINFIPFSLNKLSDFDIDYVGIYFGIARSGKSTFCLDNIRRTYCFQHKVDYDTATKQMCVNGFFDENILYEKKASIDSFYKTHYNSDLFIDEGYLVSDKREIVKTQENKLIHAINVFANHNNRTHVLIQNYQHIDFRLRDKALLDFYTFKRGDVYCFSEFKTALMQNMDHFDVENQEQYIFTDPRRFVSFLKRREGFIKELHPKKLDEVNDPLYISYLDWKKDHQSTI